MATRDEVSRPCDLVVVGAGAGGMCAALVAALEGLDVTLIEASDQVGGTTSTSAGTLWVPGNTQGARAGTPDSLDDARRYLDSLIGRDDRYASLREAYLASGAEAIDYLEARSAVRFRSAGLHPDYLDLPGAAGAGRAISPTEFDGRLLGRSFARIRPPMARFMVLGGMMVGKADIDALLHPFGSTANLRRVAGLVGRYLRDRITGHGRGTRLVMGNALVAQLLHSLQQTRVDIRYGERLTRLLRDGSRVVGVETACEGAPRRRLASMGVVLACGGIGHDDALRAALGATRFSSRSLSAASNLGDGLKVARDIGAALWRSTPDFLWQPVSRVPEGAGAVSLYPHLFMDRAKPGLLAVDGRGRRFANEGASYHHFVEGLRAACATGDTAPPAYLICSAAFVERYGLGAVHPGTARLARWQANGYLVIEDTIDRLALRLQLDAATLRASVEQMNDAAASGHDLHFGKGRTAVSRFNGDPAHLPNPCLAPLGSAPYVALAIWPGESASSSGLATSADGAVLDEAGDPIPGLHACGNDMASIWNGTYPGPGATLGPAIVFAYRAVRHLMAERAAAAIRSPTRAAAGS